MSASACPELHELEDLALGRLDAESSRAHSTHAAHCASCAARLDGVRANLALERDLGRLFTPRARSRFPSIEGFEIVAELGRGGMGVVYEARQLVPERAVALKVVRGSQYVDAATLRLFQREIRVLARLEHPGIARLFDAGCTDEGEHWFAMELVRGEPLSKAAERLERAERLALFLDLCAAIDFAHARGVVHRDLKPSNVLVEANRSGGRVRVLDFGLAKITDQDVAQSSLATEVGAIRGTLAYMSPEQARGEPSAIDLRADVYALGVILYELLTGRLPYDVGGLHLAEAARRIQESAPLRPSSIDAALRGELETIVLKALEKDPARRYASASALGEDVRRHLAHEPILARAPSGLYHARKLLQRHKLASALAATTFVLALGAAAWTSTLYAREARLRTDADRHARAADAARREEALARAAADARGREALAQARRAEAEAARARTETRTQERITEFLLDLYASADPDRTAKGNVTAREMLDRSAAMLDTLADEPQVRAALELAVGQVYSHMGLYEDARRRYERGVALRRALDVSDPVELGEALNLVGVLEMTVGNHAAAARAHEEADCLTADATGEGVRVSAASRTYLANLRKLAGDLGGAEQLAREALAILARGGDARSETLIGAKQCLSMILHQQRRDAEAEALATEVVDLRRNQEGASLRLSIALSNLGLAKLSRGNWKEGEPLVRECFELRRELLGADNPALAGAHANLAWACDCADLRDEALAHYERAIELCERAPERPRALLATAWKNLAKLHKRCARLEQAREACHKAIEIRESQTPRDELSIADCHDVLGQIEFLGSRFALAEEAQRKTIEVYERKLGPRNLRTAMARANLGVTLLHAERIDESEAALREALDALTEHRTSNPAAHASAARWLVKLYERKGDAESASRYRALAPR